MCNLMWTQAEDGIMVISDLFQVLSVSCICCGQSLMLSWRNSTIISMKRYIKVHWSHWQWRQPWSNWLEWMGRFSWAIAISMKRYRKVHWSHWQWRQPWSNWLERMGRFSWVIAQAERFYSVGACPCFCSIFAPVWGVVLSKSLRVSDLWLNVDSIPAIDHLICNLGQVILLRLPHPLPLP
jgi:hypothetical protein